MTGKKCLSLASARCGALVGDVVLPGDKSISHRSLIFSSMAVGQSIISGLLEGEDVLDTAKALCNFGVNISKDGDNWIVDGVGVGGLISPEGNEPIDMGNSGTGVRLLMGLVAPYNFDTTFVGDKSLSSRPMKRVTTPLSEMGAEFSTAENGRLPLTVKGTGDMFPIEYTLTVASAQVKSAMLLAALNIVGKTTIIEPVATRDHTEIMMRHFGVDIEEKNTHAGKKITITGQPELTAQDIKVPSDPSSAAFLVAAALIVPDSKIVIRNICVNPLRIGLYTTLIEMGGNIEFINERTEAGEKIADISASYSKLKAVEVPASRAPSMIDEYPILAVVASCAEGHTIMYGLEELRVKESDRLAAIAEGLERCGVNVSIGENDSLTVEGSANIAGGCEIATRLDHRLAMSFLVLGMVAENPVTIDDGSVIDTSFPEFRDLMNGLGANIAQA